MADARPIIIIKKKGGHGGHHGGAWKVAYADFVTAMMALFIVLWLLNTAPQVKKAVEGYFKDPAGFADKKGSNMAGVGPNLTMNKDDMPKLKEEIEKAFEKVKGFNELKSHVEMTITSEGLRIELLESETGTFFETGKAEPNDKAKELLLKLAEELGKLPNHVSIEGHTDSRPYSSGRGYSNWELSTDRANAARRLVQFDGGMRNDQVKQVRGFADQSLRKPDAPQDASNRRISVIVQYLSKTEPDKPAEKAEGHEGGEAKPAAKEEHVAPAKEVHPVPAQPAPNKH